MDSEKRIKELWAMVCASACKTQLPETVIPGAESHVGYPEEQGRDLRPGLEMDHG